ncbi:unnamed protein product [Brachionus calyciflorus]|uniref:Alpha-tubulin N-acetyltransferase n=1 Tax=Brachionus calyciflorus TaxID=104777 RepID=A0A814D8M5_9BILA|nr:unnamed protein product [Brachionus calyciflorus]
MNFEFEINAMLPHEITKFNSDLRIIHPSYVSEGDSNYYQLNRDMRQKVAYLIDKIGEASSKTQGLKETITSFRKFNLNDQHRIYLMKDSQGNNGRGSLVGMLKVGEKRLFVHDVQGQTHELMPLCVLDFYVYENQQRKGYGLCLFNKMLEMENVSPEHLAIDSPSEKSMRFLKKHYNLKNPINQVNNFVVFSGFFENRPNLHRRNNRKFDSAKTFKNELPPLDPKILNRSDSVDSKLRSRGESFSNSNKNSSVINLNYQPVQNIGQFNQPLQNSSSSFSSKSANLIENRSLSNNLKPDINENQNKYNPFFERQFNEKHRYDPFPSLNPFNNRTNSFTPVNTKPPLPPQTENKNNLNENLNYRPPIQNTNNYNPFPSLVPVKSNTNTDLYSNQFYMNSKYRRTKLW